METRILVECTEIDDSKSLVFFCPGCNYNHSFRIEAGSQPEKPVWEWNGDMCKPTLARKNKPNDRGEKDRLYAITITDLHKIVSFFDTAVMREDNGGVE